MLAQYKTGNIIIASKSNLFCRNTIYSYLTQIGHATITPLSLSLRTVKKGTFQTFDFLIAFLLMLYFLVKYAIIIFFVFFIFCVSKWSG
jgi:hypothetical protein